MTEEEKQQKYNEFLERQKLEREYLTMNGAFTEEQAEALQAYCEMYFYKRT